VTPWRFVAAGAFPCAIAPVIDIVSIEIAKKSRRHSLIIARRPSGNPQPVLQTSQTSSQP
jgi:hypothetical protein